MDCEKLATCYAINMHVDQFTRITARDNEEPTYETTLCALLDKLDGVSNVDYDGHFGAVIYLTLNVDQDTVSGRAQVMRTIRGYLDGQG